MKTLFSDEIISFLEEIFKDKVNDKIQFGKDATWDNITDIYEKLINDSIFQEDKQCKNETKYEHLECQNIWDRVLQEEHFKKACLIELVLEFRRFRHIYHSPKMGSGIYFMHDKEEFRTRKINGKVVKKADEEAEMSYDEQLWHIDANVDIMKDYDGESDEDIFLQKRRLAVKGNENHIFLPGRGKDIENRVERLKEKTEQNGFYLPIDVLNLIEVPDEGPERENPQSEYVAENVYTRLSAAVLEDDDIYSYFYISEPSGEGDKRANGYRSKTVQDARKVHSKFCEFLSEGKQSPLEANIWAEELDGFFLGSKLFVALSGLFNIFSCNSRNIRVDCKGEKYSLDKDTQDFFLLLESIVENLIQVHSQYLRIVLVNEIAAECEKRGSKIHARNDTHKTSVIDFLREINLFLKDLVYNDGVGNINKKFLARHRLMTYLVYKAKPNLSAEANSVEKEVDSLVEKLQNILEQDFYWGISEGEWEHICDETADRKKGKVLYDKIARAIMRYNFKHNCETTYLDKRKKELFPDEIWAKLSKKGGEDIIARYCIEEKIFDLKQIVKKVKDGEVVGVFLIGLLYVGNVVQLVKISYSDFLKSNATLITEKK